MTGIPFDGSRDLNADADLITGGTLVDFKASHGEAPRKDGVLQRVRLHLNGHDDTARWTALIRAHLDAPRGRAVHSRRMAAPIVYDAHGDRIYSFRG